MPLTSMRLSCFGNWPSYSLYETEQFVLAETLRDVADHLDHGRPQRLVLITPHGPTGNALYRIAGRGETRGP